MRMHSLKMIMLIASYPQITEESEYLRRCIQTDKNDPHAEQQKAAKQQPNVAAFAAYPNRRALSRLRRKTDFTMGCSGGPRVVLRRARRPCAV